MKKTQKDLVREKLLKDGEISNHWAIDTRLTTRLGAIIFKLREEGFVIGTEFIPETKDCIYTLTSRPKKTITKHRMEFREGVAVMVPYQVEV